MEPEREYCDSLILKRSGQPTQFPSGFTPLRIQQMCDQESPFFPIPGSIQKRERIIGQEKELFRPKEKRGRPYYLEIAVPGERIIKKPQIVVNTSDESGIPKIRNDIFTHIEHNVVTPESTKSGNTLWIPMS
ncbi:hypothetical protein O181_072858 [Austropuccinia psidii MF-1]|uniref:Uncharacterized protein n=1 Tax=Austropuccinia psidii MF-1 TaxID=1389203 RepID=A0A9Q3F837_9BASI|nr:hypothetical protein [Austropuccinia psidii MF-1]